MQDLVLTVPTMERMAFVLPIKSMFCFSTGCPLYYVNWIQYPSIMPLKEYQIKEDWYNLPRTPKARRSDYVRAYREIEFLHHSDFIDDDYDRAIGYELIDTMKDIERIAYEAVYQRIDIRIVQYFVSKHLFTLYQEDWFYLCYNKAMEENEQYWYDEGYQDGIGKHELLSANNYND